MPTLSIRAGIDPILPELDEPGPLGDAPIPVRIGANAGPAADGGSVAWIRVTGLPAGATLSAGVPDGDGWLIDAAALDPCRTIDANGSAVVLLDLTVTPPQGYLGTFDVAVLAAIRTEGQPDAYASAVAPAPAAGLAGGHAFAGGTGADRLEGLDGADTLAGLSGDDVLLGLWGADVLLGGDGADLLDGGDDGDLLEGGAGADEILAGSGDDTLDGGAGDDLLLAFDGNDLVAGGEGADRFVFGPGFEAGFGHDTIADFDPLADRIELSFSPLWSAAEIRAAVSQAGADVVVALSPDSSVTVLAAEAEAVLRNILGESAYGSYLGA